MISNDFDLYRSKFSAISRTGVVVVLYDGECQLCINASRLATKILSKKFSKIIQNPIQKITGREISSQDDFTIIMPDVRIFQGADAWVEILTQNRFLSYMKPLTKIKPMKYLIMAMYKFISRFRKIMIKNKGCNCQ